MGDTRLFPPAFNTKQYRGIRYIRDAGFARPRLNDYQLMVKRAFDLIVGIPSLILVLPFLA